MAVATAQQQSGTAAPPGGAPRFDTPTRLWLLLVTAVAAVLAVGCFAGVGLADRESAASHAGQSTEALYAEVQDLSYNLADANATAATALLIGPATPSQFTNRYNDDINQAEVLLAAASQRVAGDGYASGELESLAEQIPVYTGLVGQALADNRFGIPVAGAYLRQASLMLTGPMLLETGNVITEQQNATSAGIGSASSFSLWIFLVGVLALAVLWRVGRLLSRISHRRLNPGLLAGVLVVVALFVWSLFAFDVASGQAEVARSDFGTVSQAQTETSQLSLAETYVALQQIDRGEDQGTDAAAARQALSAASPVGKTLPAIAATRQAQQDFASLNTCAGNAIGLATGGDFGGAIAATVGDGKTGVPIGEGGCEPAAGALRADLLKDFTAGQQQFDADLTSLGGDYAGSAALWLGIVLGLLGAGGAAYGVNRRLAEFR